MVTPLQALREALGEQSVVFSQAIESPYPQARSFSLGACHSRPAPPGMGIFFSVSVLSSAAAEEAAVVTFSASVSALLAMDNHTADDAHLCLSMSLSIFLLKPVWPVPPSPRHGNSALSNTSPAILSLFACHARTAPPCMGIRLWAWFLSLIF